MTRFLPLFLALSVAAFAAEYTPATARFGQYSAGTYQGVVGGIPDRAGGTVWDVADYGWSSGASASTNSAAFASALAASASGDIISIPAGTFATTGLTITYTHSNRTIRGAGKTATILQNTGSGSALTIGGDTNYGNTGNATSNVVSLGGRGSTSVTVVDGTMPSIYQHPTYGGNNYTGGRRLARLYLPNEQATPVISVYASAEIRNPTVMVVSRSGNVLTLSQPLPSSFSAALAAGTARLELASTLQNEVFGVGIEDLTFDGVNSTGTFTTRISFAEGCWFKNVKVINPGNYALYLFDSVSCEVRHCDILGAGEGSNHAGLLMNNASYNLVEDNIITGVPNVEVNFSTMGSVFAYNYGASGFNGNHGPHNSYNLWEGNAIGYYQADGYFGGVSEETLSRNWFRNGGLGSLKRFTRNFNLIGNLVGTVGQTYPSDYTQDWGNPNIGNESSSGTAQLSTANYWADWDSAAGRPLLLPGTLTTRTSDTAGVVTLSSGGGALLSAANTANGDSIRGLSGHNFVTVTNITGDVVTFTTGSHTNVSEGSAVTISPSPPGFQQRDLDVIGTAIRKANWYVFYGNIPSGESLGGDTLPASYFRTSKPAYFGDRPWPPYDSASPGTPADTNIPAGYRYINGNEDYLGGCSIPEFSPTPGTYGSTQSVTLTCATSGATIYYTLDGTTPTNGSSVYSSALSVATTKTIKAFAVKSGLTDSSVTSGTYTIGGGSSSTATVSGTTTVTGTLTLP